MIHVNKLVITSLITTDAASPGINFFLVQSTVPLCMYRAKTVPQVHVQSQKGASGICIETIWCHRYMFKVRMVPQVYLQGPYGAQNVNTVTAWCHGGTVCTEKCTILEVYV